MYKLFATTFLFFISYTAFTQTTFTASSPGGNWNLGTTWGGTCTSGCIEGTDYPGSTDDAVIPNGVQVTVTSGATCRNIFIDPNTNGALNLGFFGDLTITGTLLANGGVPSLNVINPGFGGLLTFTGQNTNTTGIAQLTNNEIIALWNSNAPLPQCIFNLTQPSSINFIANASFLPDDLVFSSGFTINSGQLSTLESNINSIQISTGNLQIQSNATLNLTVPLTQSGPTTSITQANINGTFFLGSNAYINANSFTLNAGALLDIAFNGVNQTEGWWNQSISPTSITVDPNSTIRYSANANQIVYAGTTGNLWLSGNSGIVKTLQPGNNTLAIQGDLDIDNVEFDMSLNMASRADIRGNVFNDGVWTPGKDIRFDGTATQSIQGGNTINFQSIEIGRPGGVVSSNVSFDEPMIVNDELIVYNTSSLTNNSDITYRGNIVNNGVLQSSNTAIDNFDGTTSLSGTIPPEFGDINISGTLSATSNFSLIGDFTNNGVFDPQSSTVTFDASSGNQNINGSATFYDLQINSNTNVNGIIDLERSITLGSGVTFDAIGSGNGEFTLKSTSASNSAFVNPVPSSSSIEGEITVERFVPFYGRKWRYIASPVQNIEVEDWQNNFVITGSFSGSNTGTGLLSNPSLYLYNESLTGSVNIGWEPYPVSSNQESISLGTGYSAFFRDGSYRLINDRITVRGTIKTGDHIFGLSYTSTGSAQDDGWNLLGNPYPSPIDWTSGNWTKTGIDANVSIRETQSSFDGTFLYNNGTTGTFDGNIAAGQAFWVQTISSTNQLIVTENAKSSTATFIRKTPVRNMLRMSIYGDNAYDVGVIHFRDDAKKTYEREFDAYKRDNDNFDMSFLTEDSVNVAINSLPMNNCSEEIVIGMNDFTAGDYEIVFSNLGSFDLAYDINLIDNYLDTKIPVQDSLVYHYNVNNDSLSGNTGRFILQFKAKKPDLNLVIDASTACVGSNGQVKIENTEKGIDYFLTRDNEKITKSVQGNGSDVTIEIDTKYLSYGENSFNIIADNKGCFTNMFDANVKVLMDSAYEISSVTNGISCGVGTIELSVEATKNTGFYRLYESELSENPVFESSDGNFTINGLEKSKLYFVSYVSEFGCETKDKKEILAEVINLDSLKIIDEDDGYLSVNFSEGIQWYFNNELIKGANEARLEIFDTGEYAAEITIKGCSNRVSIFKEFDITDIREPNLIGIFKLYPNPVINNHIKIMAIENSDHDFSKTKFEILDLNGKRVFKSIVKTDKENIFDVGHLSSGLYIFRFEFKHEIIREKIYIH